MTMKMDDFLLEYFRRLHFSKMPMEQFSRFCDYAKANNGKGDFAGNMKKWTDLLEKDADGKYVFDAFGIKKKEQLNPETDLSPEEWHKLYKAFETAFRGMDANRKSFKYNDKATTFLDEYFGSMFQHPTASAEAEAQIANLRNLLESHRDELSYILGSYLGDLSYDDLLKGIDEKKYNSNPEFKGKVASSAQVVLYHVNSNAETRQALGLKAAPDFSAITDEEKFEVKNYMEKYNIEMFKSDLPNLLNTLYSNGKVFEVFSQYDKNKISKPLNEARENMQYDKSDSKDYIPPKAEEELSIPERISKWWGNTYSENFEKIQKVGDRVFKSPQAKLICEAIDKEKIKPSDGLKKIIDSAEKIKGRIKAKSNTASEHFDWMIKTLKTLDSDGNLNKTFEGALRNGGKLRKLVTEIIIKALEANPPKKAEAQTAMEVLSVIKYGLTTSKVMDAFNSSDFSIFSDKNLSWNKNAGVQFVTNALDKSLKFTFKVLGYGLTAAGNLVRSRGRKFNGNSKELKTMIERDKAAHEAKRTGMENRLAAYDTQIAALEAETSGARRHNTTRTSNVITALQDELNKLSEECDIWGLDPETGEASTEEVDQIKEIVAKLQKQAQVLTHGGAEQSRIDEANDQLNQAQTALAETQARYAEQKIHENELKPKIAATRKKLEKAQDRLQKKQEQITKFNQATSTLEAMKEERDALQEKINNIDDSKQSDFADLMAYWDKLETGRTFHTGSQYKWTWRSKKTHQADYDKVKDTEFDDYIKAYKSKHFGMAA